MNRLLGPIRAFKRLIQRPRNEVNRSYVFYDIGFHGDLYLIPIVSHCLAKADQFIETGANVGSTASYVSREFPDVAVYSCEPDKGAFEQARSRTEYLTNIRLFNSTSLEMLCKITQDNRELVNRETVFWLDAHGYGYEWPLKEEVAFITKNFKKGYMFIDDFRVPDMDIFKWDNYDGQECSFEFIKDSINEGLGYSLYYPCYTEKTSAHHALTGWGLIDFGHEDDLDIPEALRLSLKQWP